MLNTYAACLGNRRASYRPRNTPNTRKNPNAASRPLQLVIQHAVFALSLFLQAAEMNDASAQYAVGFIYHQHRSFIPLFGAGKHFADILRWWTRAAENGHSEAQYMVGTFHQTGFCTPFDLAEAKKWFERAASKGHGGAKARLRKMGAWNVVNVIPLVNLWVGETPATPAVPR